jgi:hypothetical protein
MDIEIIKDILEQTKSCEKNFSCLSDQTDLCEMRSRNPKKVYFVKYPKGRRCRYEYSFGYSNNICTCPTRQEIYRSYRI